MDRLPIKRALLSVTHKDGLVEFGRFLVEAGAELVSTGGTHKTLVEAGLPVTQVSDVTGFPEILGGRVKTLHPRIHGGLLADKDDPAHMATLAELEIATVDLVAVNLYDFAKAAAKNAPMREAVESIDIGGPTLLRAAAKNFHSVMVAPEPAFYAEIIAEMSANDMTVGLPLRQRAAMWTFELVSRYDAMITEFFRTH